MTFEREISGVSIGPDDHPRRIASRHTEAVIQAELRRMARALRGEPRTLGVRRRLPMASGDRFAYDDPSR